MRDVGPSYPGFHTHAMKHLAAHDGRKIWNSYIESRTPSAWRMYWIAKRVAHVLDIRRRRRNLRSVHRATWSSPWWGIQLTRFTHFDLRGCRSVCCSVGVR
jgi:hypothetical protein